MPDSIRVEVVCAWPDDVFRCELELPEGSTVAAAVERSAVCVRWPEAADPEARFGIFSRQVARDHVLRDGDRVEVYRPLLLDPKEARRRRAARRG